MGLDITVYETSVPPEKFYEAYRLVKEKYPGEKFFSCWGTGVKFPDGSPEKLCLDVTGGEERRDLKEVLYWRKDYELVNVVQEYVGQAIPQCRGLNVYKESLFYPFGIYLTKENGLFDRLKKFDIWENWENPYLGLEYPLNKKEARARVIQKIRAWREAEESLKKSGTFLVMTLSG